MSSPPLARRLARILAADPGDAGGAPRDREATVSAMARALRARKRRRARKVWLGGLAAVAAAAFGLFVATHHPARPAIAAAPVPVLQPAVIADEVSGGVLVLSKGSTSPVFNGMPLREGDHLLALLDGHATLALATGTRLAVAGGGDVALLSEGFDQNLRPRRGQRARGRREAPSRRALRHPDRGRRGRGAGDFLPRRDGSSGSEVRQRNDDSRRRLRGRRDRARCGGAVRRSPRRVLALGVRRVARGTGGRLRLPHARAGRPVAPSLGGWSGGAVRARDPERFCSRGRCRPSVAATCEVRSRPSIACCLGTRPARSPRVPPWSG